MVRVQPDARTLDKTFDYQVPEGGPGRPSLPVRVGTVVRVPLHGRRVRGWVVADGVTPPPGVRLLPLAAVVGHGPAPEVVELAEWAAWRWAGRRRALLTTASPPMVVRALPAPAAPTGGAPPGEGAAAALAGEALAHPRSVVRLPPAAPAGDLVVALAARGPVLVVAASLGGADVAAAALAEAGRAVARVPRQWAAAAAGGASVVGARAAAWAPAPSVAAVLVLDAHDEALQEERAPTWNAWEVAAERAARAGVPCVVVSPCPTLAQLAWGRLVRLSRTDERAGWPPVVVVDRRREDPRAGLYSARLVEVVRGERPVACILNRRGRSRLLACAACGEVTRCEHCEGALRLDGDGAELGCGRCGRSRPVLCQACGRTTLKNLRVGVTRAREELAALAGRAVGEVAGDTADVPPDPVLVGTEALLHRLPSRWRGGVVAFLDFDQELLAPRYRAGEQALALLARAARAVGPRAEGGRVLVQTRAPGTDVLAAAVHADPGRFSGPEAARRAALDMPPCSALALVSGEAAAAYVGALPSGTDVLGPDDGRYLVRARDPATLATLLSATPRPPGRLRIAVDPARL